MVQGRSTPAILMWQAPYGVLVERLHNPFRGTVDIRARCGFCHPVFRHAKCRYNEGVKDKGRRLFQGASARTRFTDNDGDTGTNMVEDNKALKVSFLVTVLNETESLRKTVDTIFALAAEDVLEVLLVIAPHTTAASRTVIGELAAR